MSKKIRKHVSVSGRSDWMFNPLTWLCAVLFAYYLTSFAFLYAVGALVLAVSSNIKFKYDTEIETFK